MKRIIKTHNQSGTTILELVVAVSIFAVIMLAVLSTFQIVMDSQKRAIGEQQVQESMRYVFEAISKEARMALRSDDGVSVGCSALATEINKPITTTNRVYNTNADSSAFYFMNSDEYCVAYYLVGDSLVISKKLDSENTHTATTTPESVKVTAFRIKSVDNAITSTPGDLIHPMVIFNADVEYDTPQVKYQNKMTLQTAVSARNYEY